MNKIETYTKDRRYKHLTWNDRCVMERMLRSGASKPDIAIALDCCLATVYNELARGAYVHTKSDLTEELRYAADKGQLAYEASLKGRNEKLRLANPPKLLRDPALISMIQYTIIKEKCSPQAALRFLERDELFNDVVIKSKNTIYSGIIKGYFPDLTYEELPEGRHTMNRRHTVTVAKRAAMGPSIEKRDDAIMTRNCVGHWEMDTVHGQATNRKYLLVMTERKTRFEIVEKLKSCTTDEVRKALNRIEKRFGSKFYSVFKTITVDNGTEFSDYESMKKALYRVGDRTSFFYCHPGHPQERGSNENANKMIRRFAPKGANFDALINKKLVDRINEWINDYPREQFAGQSSSERFYQEFGFIA